MTLTPQHDNQVVVQNGFVADMNRGDTIGSLLGPTNQWANGRLTIGLLATLLGDIPGGNGEDGNFVHKPSGYIGFDLVDNGTNYYGWMYAVCPSLGGLTGDAGIFAYITDWAYETAPDTPIQAGQISEPVFFTANLTGPNEVPPNRSANSGTGTFTLESFVDGSILTFHLELGGSFRPTDASVCGPPMRAGRSPVLIADLGMAQIIFSSPPPPPGPVPFVSAKTNLNPPIIVLPPPSQIVYDGQITLSSNQIAELQRGQLYVNLESAKFRQGELRGQIWPSAPVQFSASLSSHTEFSRSQNVPRGEAQFTLSGTALSYEIAVDTTFTRIIAGIYGPGICQPEVGNRMIWLNTTYAVRIPPGGFPNAPGLPGQLLYSGQLTLPDTQISELHNGQSYLEVLAPHSRNGWIGGRITQTP